MRNVLADVRDGIFAAPHLARGARGGPLVNSRTGGGAVRAARDAAWWLTYAAARGLDPVGVAPPVEDELERMLAYAAVRETRRRADVVRLVADARAALLTAGQSAERYRRRLLSAEDFVSHDTFKCSNLVFT